jgi:hypothetical protein
MFLGLYLLGNYHLYIFELWPNLTGDRGQLFGNMKENHS